MAHLVQAHLHAVGKLLAVLVTHGRARGALPRRRPLSGAGGGDCRDSSAFFGHGERGVTAFGRACVTRERKDRQKSRLRLSSHDSGLHMEDLLDRLDRWLLDQRDPLRRLTHVAGVASSLEARGNTLSKEEARAATTNVCSFAEACGRGRDAGSDVHERLAVAVERAGRLARIDARRKQMRAALDRQQLLTPAGNARDTVKLRKGELLRGRALRADGGVPKVVELLEEGRASRGVQEAALRRIHAPTSHGVQGRDAAPAVGAITSRPGFHKQTAALIQTGELLASNLCRRGR
mmetsp:Transcript_6893/g.14453  ORF Transcript_6893/g.14453 Transcript_6893/m.14453 type:complete len:292 (+) Transcript_6893:60-935(+)